MSTYAARYAEFRRRQKESSPTIEEFQNLYDFDFDDFQSGVPSAWRRAWGARRRAHRLRQDRRRRVRCPPGAGQGRKCFYTTPIKALSNQKYADLVRRYGAASGPAHRGQQHQRRRAGGGDDHRGAAQHAVRGLADAVRPRLRRAWTRCTTWLTGPAARCGRKSSSTCPNRSRSWRCPRRSATPRSSANGWIRSAATRR